MKNIEVVKIINKINDYLYEKLIYEVSLTTMLKVDKFLQDLRDEIMEVKE